MPQTLTVSIDAEKHPGGAAAGPGADATGGSPNAAVGWRANVQGSSRACALRRPKADAMAEDALGLVRKWTADRWVGHLRCCMFVWAGAGTCRMLLWALKFMGGAAAVHVR